MKKILFLVVFSVFCAVSAQAAGPAKISVDAVFSHLEALGQATDAYKAATGEAPQSLDALLNGTHGVFLKSIPSPRKGRKYEIGRTSDEFGTDIAAIVLTGYVSGAQCDAMNEKAITSIAFPESDDPDSPWQRAMKYVPQCAGNGDKCVVFRRLED